MSTAVTSLAVIARDIKLAHSVFALPFALLAATMALADADGRVDWRAAGLVLGLVVAAMVLARTWAMLANRLLDRELDGRNPRTARRALPSGALPLRHAVAALVASAGLFAVVCAAFGLLRGNWWPLILCVPVLAWIGGYGLAKRFTSLCHVWLGASLAISPLAAVIAVDPSALAQPAPWWLAAMVLGWVAGFDVIYALQDVDVDVAEGLHSLPSRLGSRRALQVSRALHGLAFASLFVAWRTDPRLGPIFGVGVALTGLLLVVEHATVHRWGTSRIGLAFFTLNGVISCLLGGLGMVDVLA